MQSQTKKEVDPLHKPPSWRKIVYFNGPPQVGKTFGAEAMRSFVQINATWMRPRHLDAAEPLKKAAHALYSVFNNWDYYDTKDGAPLKGLACGDFLGLSPREAYIALSEEYLKVKHGDEVLGHILRKRIVRENTSQFFVVSNCSFVPELRPVIDLFGQRNVMVIEVHAAGKDFKDDSRGYVGEQVKKLYPHVQVKKLVNVIGDQEDKEFYKMLCEGLVKNFLNIEEKDG